MKSLKPKDHIIQIITNISSGPGIKSSRDRQIIYLQQNTQPMVFLLHEGFVAVYRTDDNMLLAHTEAPAIFGANLFSENKRIHIQARGSIRYELITKKHFIVLVEEKNLWKPLSYTISFIATALMDYVIKSTSLPTYHLIRNNLNALMAEPDEVRLRTNASDYLMEKTRLSRSGVMKVLSDLRKGGHIEMHRGILLNIYQLPSRY